MDENYDYLGKPDRYDNIITFLYVAMNECLPEGKKTKSK